jgi:endonuclease G
MAEGRDREMKLFVLLGIVLAVVLLTVIGYFAWEWYQDQQKNDLSRPAATGPAGRVRGSGGGVRSGPAISTAKTAPAATGPLSYDTLVFGGLPKAPASENVIVLENKGYVSGYSETRRDPLFVAYRVFDAGNVSVAKRPAKFSVDPRSKAGVDHDDYTGSGYDRGHMAPNHIIAKCYGDAGQLESFLVTNICPQTAVLNQQVWEGLERLEGDVYPLEFGNVWVMDGPIFDANPKTIGVHKVQVPVAFYKILIENHTGVIRTMQVIMPQDVVSSDKGNLAKFMVSIRDIEAKTGLDFFPDLPQEEQDRLETKKSEVWEIPAK